MNKPGYQDRVVHHSLLWVNGICKHNHVDDECVADFSCCRPELLTHDDEERQRSHQQLITRIRKREQDD